MKNIIVITAKLLVIVLVAAVLLGVVNSVTKEPIAQRMAEEAREARLSVFPEAADFAKHEIEIPAEYSMINEIYDALDENNNIIGATVSITTKGYSSGLNLTVGIGADGTIKGVKMGSNEETPGFGKKAEESWFSDRYAGKQYDKPLSVTKSSSPGEYEVEAITGATITSKGITNAVNIATEFYRQYCAQTTGGSK
jgi:electron transport complex protein RnfG